MALVLQGFVALLVLTLTPPTSAVAGESDHGSDTTATAHCDAAPTRDVLLFNTTERLEWNGPPRTSDRRILSPEDTAQAVCGDGLRGGSTSTLNRGPRSGSHQR